MKVRELLRYEIWSKETSRKIFRPTGRLLKRVAIVLGVLVVLIGIVCVVERYWLTNGERTSGKAALKQVEELEKLIDCNCDRFAEVDSAAKTAVEVAEKSERTLRDGSVVAYLSVYLMEVEQLQTKDLREAELKLFMQQRHLQWHSDQKLENEGRSLQSQIFSELRSALHKELD
jgi:hypothetical protein